MLRPRLALSAEEYDRKTLCAHSARSGRLAAQRPQFCCKKDTWHESILSQVREHPAPLFLLKVRCSRLVA